ncbi:MAG: iron-containing alcohol dehydrogenase [Angelakisella sp.]
MNTLRLAGDKIIMGEDAVGSLAELQGERAFIVTSGAFARESGQLALLLIALDKASMAAEVFEDVEPDPEFSSVKAGAKRMQDFQPDWIIALGGGSAMDAAKGMWVLYEHPELDTLEKLVAPNAFTTIRKKAQLICIPTTSGTGSEVSKGAVISDKARNLKLVVRSDILIPDIAVLDPVFTVGMPFSLTAHSGFDALTHAVEAYVSKRANPMSDVIAESTILGIFDVLPKILKDPQNKELRLRMHVYSTSAGVAFTNSGLGVVHSIAHAFGAIYHIPHGLANAIALPYVLREHNKFAPAGVKLQRLANLLGEDNLISAIEKMAAECQIPSAMMDAVKEKDTFDSMFSNLVEKSLADGCNLGNPYEVDRTLVETLIKDVYFGMKA